MREEVIRNRAELKKKSLERTCILFFSEGGAMGCPGEVIFRSDDGGGGLTSVDNGKMDGKGMNAARQSCEHFSSMGSDPMER